MGAPPSSSPSTSSAPRGRRLRSTGLIGARRRRGDQAQPAPSPPATPPSSPPMETKALTPPAGVAVLRRSGRNHHLRIRGLPSGTPPAAPRRRRRDPSASASAPRKSIQAWEEEWGKEKLASGAPKEECVLPFLRKGAPRKVECLICSKSIQLDERIECSVNHCEVTLHKACSAKHDGCCPRHICFYCKRRNSKRPVKHKMPACTECSLKQNRMIDSEDPSRAMICWSLWPSTSEDAGPANSIEEAFRRLPLPYTDQEFSIGPNIKKDLENETEPPPYIHLKCNAYVVKSKCCDDAIEDGCVNCDHHSTCQSCSCRSALISCSQACNCSVKCSNKPFRREKKIKIVKTQHCGWGVITLESIEEGDFVIEFVGEVIDDATCEERLMDMRQRRYQNFYLCKVSKDFVIDATFKGNACRFLNHSCEPNCRLEKWQVNGKIGLGVFASEAIEAGMPLTYDYRFSTSYGPKKTCFCGTKKCRGKL